MPVNNLDAELSALRARAEVRWAQLGAEQPSLARAIDLQRRTIRHQLDLLGELASSGVGTPPDESLVLHRLTDGLPVLRAGIAPLPVERLVPVMQALSHDAEAVTGYTAASRLAEALAAGAIDGARLLALAYQRDERGVRQLAVEQAVVVDLLWLIADAAIAPVLNLQQHAALREDEPESPVREALERWDQGYCPACGSWPALAESFGGERLLRCAGCAATWRMLSDRCTFCSASGPEFRMVAPERERPGRRLELCRVCGGYLKTLDAERLTPFPLLAVEDLGSSDLDQAALHHGFRRLPLPTLRG